MLEKMNFWQVMSCITCFGICPPIIAQDKIPVVVIQNDSAGTCPSDSVRELARKNITRHILKLLQNDFSGEGFSCGEGDWLQVAYLNMSEHTQQCPSPWREHTVIRSCGRSASPSASCSSTIFTTNGIQYSKVCGRAIGYQYRTPSAFQRYVPQTTGTPDDNYVDGVSMTHGSNPRKHIWTFANGVYEARDDLAGSSLFTCPCARLNDSSFGAPPPSYVGNNYFCESGNFDNFWSLSTHYTDPLWDGEGCIHSECCSFNSPPWFSVTLPNPTADDIEVRICADQDTDDEDTTIELLEIYIQQART